MNPPRDLAAEAAEIAAALGEGRSVEVHRLVGGAVEWALAWIRGPDGKALAYGFDGRAEHEVALLRLARSLAERTRERDEAQARADDNEQRVAEAYQVVGHLADHAGLFAHDEVIRALDRLSWKEGTGELCPWPRGKLLGVEEALRADRDEAWAEAGRLHARIAELEAGVGRNVFGSLAG